MSRIAEAAKLPWPQNVLYLAGDGAVLLTDPHAGNKVPKDFYALHAEKQYVPASILKIVTSGMALETLGPDYRFKTEFYVSPDGDLWIAGFGDPYLVSEELESITQVLLEKGLRKIRHIGLDNSYFEAGGLVLDGNTQTRDPYNAYNCALGVNFNTVTYSKDKRGNVSEDASRTPLTPLALEMGKKFKERGAVCLNISESPQRAQLHAGELFQAYLERAGVTVSGQVMLGETPPKSRLLYRHLSSLTLADLVRELLKYSNNYITNQIFLAMGAEAYGAPASYAKSRELADAYFRKHGLPPFIMGDGSGLSRKTSLSARQMAAVLETFEPERSLLSSRKKLEAKGLGELVSAKTGTMSGIQTLAGYIERPDEPDKPYSFVILLNGASYEPGTRDAILEMMLAELGYLESGQKTAAASDLNRARK